MYRLQEYKKVALCGYREKGIQLFNELVQNGKQVPYIIERNYEAFSEIYKDLKIPIVGFNEGPMFYNEAEVIVLSGDLPANIVEECFGLAEIDLPIISFTE